MGIQINGQTDTISASDGSLSIAGQELTGVTDINASGIITATSFSGDGSGLTGVGGGSSITAGNTSAEVIDTGSDGRFVVTTEGSERLRVTSAGLVGIGSNAPDSRFVIRSHSGVSDTPIFKIEHPSNDADFAISGLYDSDGNVTYLGSNLFLNSSFAVARFDTGKPSSAITLSGRTGNGEIKFLTGTATATERLIINSSGNLMVGTANDQLNGIGAPAALTAFNNGTRFGANFGASQTSSSYAVVFSNPNGQIGGVNLSGTSTSYVTSSDYRLKENVVAVANGIARLQQLKPSRFNFIADPDKTVDGFLAHEVQSVVPEAINGVKDEVDADGNPVYQGIDQSKLVPLLTAALQEAVAKIETLETRLAALEGGINS